MIVKASGSRAAALHPLRLLGKVVFRLNQMLQLSIPQPRLAIHLVPPGNPFAFTDSSLAHRSVQAWLEAEKIWLIDLRGDPWFKSVKGRNVPFELLLLSAALHGGILSTDLAMALHAAVLSPEKHVRYSIDRPYLDLSFAWQGKPDQEIRRWYPDEGVACLSAAFGSIRATEKMMSAPTRIRIGGAGFVTEWMPGSRRNCGNGM